MRVRCPACGAWATESGHQSCPKPDRNGSRNGRWDGGKSKHPLYWIYWDMVLRCTSEKHKRWKDYGGRGITVCDRWLADFWRFVEDMGERPEGYVLDRENNGGSYCPENCRWVTWSVSNKNRRASAYRHKRNHAGESHE